MSEEMVVYEAHEMQASKSKNGYAISVPGAGNCSLVRGEDFGVIRGKDGKALTKQPTLFKSGAEKLCMAYGLFQHYTPETVIEDVENGFFMYRFRCDLVKLVNNIPYTIVSGYGSANTREKRTGSQSPYDGANSALKMAKKRALVDAAIVVSGGSSLFSQDIENEDFMAQADAYKKSKNPNAAITPQQVKYFYTVASANGVLPPEAKAFLASYQIKSAKDIPSGLFDEICEQISHLHDTAPVEVTDFKEVDK